MLTLTEASDFDVARTARYYMIRSLL